MIHKEGYPTLIIGALVLGLFSFLIYKFCPIFIYYFILSASIIVYIILLQFFRNPTRNTVLNDNHVIAPCDGKVVVIEEVFEKEYFKEKRIQVSIFMSPFNVHVNRNPISGNVTYTKYHAGKYLVAYNPKSSEENERTTIVIKNEKKNIEVLFRQIAGALARRIVYYVKENMQVQQGAEMGFIKFGSRVDIFLPIDTKLNVKINDKTVGGETVLAEV